MSDNEIMQELERLPKEELVRISMERHKPSKKYPKGRLKRRARLAQHILWIRAGTPFLSSSHWKRDHAIVKKV